MIGMKEIHPPLGGQLYTSFMPIIYIF